MERLGYNGCIVSKPNPNAIRLSRPQNLRLTQHGVLPSVKEEDQSISWAYVAGFFDGEGSINCSRSGDRWGLVAKMCQTAGKHDVLSKIKEFMLSRGVESKFSTPYVKGKRKPLETLHVTTFGDCFRFLVYVSPYLIVKKERAEESLQVLRERFQMEFDLKQKLEAALFDYRLGFGLDEAAKRNGLSGGHRLRHWMLKNGHSVRPFADSVRARYKIRPKKVKTHCLNGHPLSGKNILTYPGRRCCIICQRDRDRSRKSGKNMSR